MADPTQTAAELAEAQQKLANAEAAHAAAQAESATPRMPFVVVHDILTFIAGRFGNHPQLEKLLAELKAAAAIL